MRLYIDTEFNGFGGELISMAIVSEEGHEWYEVLPLPEKKNLWVLHNVIPILGKEPIAPNVFRTSFQSFLTMFDNPTVYGDWYTEFVHFFNLFAGDSHGQSFNYECSARLINVPGELQNDCPHNALSDARSIRDWHLKNER